MLNSIVLFLRNQSKLSLLVIFLAISVFLPIPASNLAVLISFIYTIVFFKKPIVWNKLLILPILLFFWIFGSYFWSIQPKLTLESIPRTIFLLIIPLLFLVAKNYSYNLKDSVLKVYSYTAVAFSVLFLIRAVIRFFIYNTTSVFFSHGEYNSDTGIVPKEMNAIHVSVFIAIAYFYFITKQEKFKHEKIVLLILLLFLVLLSSTNVLIISLVLSLIYYFFYSKFANKLRLRNSILVLTIFISFLFYKKIEAFVELEFKNNTEKGIGHNVITKSDDFEKKITMYEAWNNKTFSQKDFFPGTAFRIYQFRVFLELFEENSVFWKGFGFNASNIKIEEKGVEHNVYLGDVNHEGYQKKNFHNQYLQIFAELGFIGFSLLVLILFFSLKTAFKAKDFIHISFTFLMISLFLTESFLWRQRGIVFFTVFYCLFAISNTKKSLQ